MKTYDLRNAGTGCIDNPALALLDVFAKGEDKIQVIVKKPDIPEDVLREVAKTAGYRVVSTREDGEDLVVVLERIKQC